MPERRDYTKSGRRQASRPTSAGAKSSDAESSSSLPGGGAGAQGVRRDYTKGGKRKRRRQFLIFSRDGYRCVYCGRSAPEDGVPLEADHIIPRSQGGEDVAGNFVTACRSCNRSKFDNDIGEHEVAWLQCLVRYRNRMRRIRDDHRIELGRV